MSATPVSHRERRAPAATPSTRRRPLQLVRPSSKGTRRSPGRGLVIGPILVLFCLLAIVGAQAFLTEGQVRLTTLQGEVSSAQTKNLDLQLQVANESQPSAVVSAAERQGMVSPAGVAHIGAVALAPPAESGARPNLASKTSKAQKRGHKSSGKR
jgi:cell division protein FtsL